MIKKFMAFSVAKKVLFVLMAIVIIVLLWLVLKNNNGNQETITVKTEDFVNQVSVSGKVIPSENVDLGFYQGGRISSIRAKVGDVVNTGNVVASVENGDLQANLLQKEAFLLREQAKLKSLEIGTRPEQIAVTESSTESAKTSLDQASQSLVNAIGDAYTKSDDAIKNKIDQLFTNPSTDNPLILLFFSNSELLNKINLDKFTINNTLKSWKTSIAQIDSNQSLDSYTNESENNLHKIKAFLDEISSVVNNPSSNYNGSPVSASWKSDTSIARANIDLAISSLESAITTYKGAQTALVIAQNNLKLQQAGATTEDIQAQVAQVKGAEADVVNARALLNKTLIVAPFGGIITKMDAKVGEIASPNISMISMMSAGTFQIESFVPEVNISQIKLGDEAKVTLDAYGENVEFLAKVILIDPAETIRNGVSTYKIKLQFEDKDERVKSGMTANVSIVIFKKPNAIIIPEGVMFEKSGKKFVQTLKDNKISEKEITTGNISSLGQVEIISGLSIGEIVVLKPKTN